MPGATIVADQSTGAGLGIPGVARNDLWVLRAVVLTCATSGNSTLQWDLLAKPAGSATTLTSSSGVTSGFTPDMVGTYRVRLVTNGGGPGNVQILVFRVRFDNTGALLQRGWAYPAFGEVAAESNYGGNLRGWAEPLETILEDIRLALVAAAGGPAGGDLTGIYPDPSVANISGAAGVAVIAAALQWAADTQVELSQADALVGATPTDFIFYGQVPDPGGGLITGQAGGFSFRIPPSVGGAPTGLFTVWDNSTLLLALGDAITYLAVAPTIGDLSHVSADTKLLGVATDGLLGNLEIPYSAIQRLPVFSGVAEESLGSITRIAAFIFDRAELKNVTSAKLTAVLEGTGGALATLQLFDVAGTAYLGAALTTASTSPVVVDAASILTDLQATAGRRLYELHLSTDTPGSAARCSLAQLECQ